MEKRMQPLISVIVPVYNGELYLKNCIESIEVQSYGPLEIIVINDGSTDGTAEVCEKLAQSYENLSFITTEDLGVSASRNQGIALAKGELLTFVDADDRLHPQMLQRLYEAMEQTGSDIAGCRFTIWNTEREWKIAANSVPVNAQTHKIYEKREYLKEQILCGNSRCWSKLYRKSLLEQMHTGQWFREGMTIGEDMLFLMDLLPETETIVEIDFHGYGYYQNPQGAMNRTFQPEYMDQIRCWEIAREQVRKLLPECESKATSILLISIMLTAGKLAGLPGSERKQYESYMRECHEKLLKERQDREAVKLLSKGYRVKVRFFALAPKLYLWCYHLKF